MYIFRFWSFFPRWVSKLRPLLLRHEMLYAPSLACVKSRNPGPQCLLLEQTGLHNSATSLLRLSSPHISLIHTTFSKHVLAALSRVSASLAHGCSSSTGIPATSSSTSIQCELGSVYLEDAMFMWCWKALWIIFSKRWWIFLPLPHGLLGNAFWRMTDPSPSPMCTSG